MVFRMFHSRTFQPRAVPPRITRLISKCVLLLAALFIITCNDVEGPDKIAEIPDSSANDTTAVRDTIPPQSITDAALFINETTYAVTLTWTAPWDDSISEPVSKYEIRYSHSYSAVDHFDLGIPAFTPPVPGPPGVEQRYNEFYNLERGKNLYAAIKSSDEAENQSIRSNIAAVHIPGYSLRGMCTEAISGYPIGGLSVAVLSGQIFRLETRADGSFEKDDLMKDLYVNVTSGFTPFPYHEYTQQMRLHGDSLQSICMIPQRSTQTGEYHSLLRLFKVLTRTTSSDLSSILRKWKRMPVKCYIPPFVNEHGLDYGAVARQAAEHWMTASGWELFSFVDARPDTGIAFEYRTSAEMGNLSGVTKYKNGDDLLPLFDTIALVDGITDAVFLYRVCLHELGHTIRLGHVYTGDYIMYAGQPLPGDISKDELAVLELLRALPNNLDMDMYDDSPAAAR